MDWKQRYTLLAEFLGHALGPDYEIVLHDLSGKAHNIVTIANPHVSGRSTSAPLSDLALDFIRTKQHESNDYMLNYEGISQDGRKLRCSTMFIKDEAGELLGMFCINFNQHKYSQFAAGILNFVFDNYDVENPTENRMTLDLVENFHESVEQRVGTILLGMFGEDLSPALLSQEQKLEIVRRLEDSGVFRVKGSIPEVAALLHSSVPSIYRYLGRVRKENESKS